ncbi:MAG: hypothetical protein ABIJ04_02365 [Bacteroidota bacterium]
MRKPIPLKQRPVDYIYLVFFFINLFFITHIVDPEQLVIKDPDYFDYPFWPLPFFIDMVHGGLNLQLVLLANAPWFFFPIFLVWKMWKNPHPFTKTS